MLDMSRIVSASLQRLRKALVDRDVETGFTTLDRLFALGHWPKPGTAGSYALLFLLAQWCDLGYRDIDFFERQLAGFARVKRRTLTVSDYLDLRFAEVYAAFARGSMDEAVAVLSALLHAHADVLDQHALFVAWFWRGRAQRVKGAFDEALNSIRMARAAASQSGAEKLDAVAKVHESWLLFYRGERQGAFDLLDQAEHTLSPTGHALSLGNIASARGRFYRHAGDYTRALGFFEQAIQLYRSQVPNHPNLGRALVNAAYVKRLQSMKLQPVRGGKALAAAHARMLQVVHEAMELLRSAREIYTACHHEAGTGSVMIHMGHLQLESGDIDAATYEAEAAFKLAESRNDAVLRARSLILQAYVEMSRSEEQMESTWYSGSPAQHAVDLAQSALEFAQQTRNRRLTAAAQITRGLAATDPALSDWDVALSCATSAAELLGSEERDHLFNELTVLRKRIVQSQSLDLNWRRWGNGETSGSSYQQIEEEFASVVIPQVWMRMGKNTSAVARHLRISPKKIRRALQNAQQLGVGKNALQ